MSRYIEDRLADRLVRQAIEVASEPWSRFVAAMVRGDEGTADARLEEWRRILARASLLMGLHGAARVNRWLRLRLPSASDDGRELPRLLFARDGTDELPTSIDMEPGAFREAIESFRGTVPRLADHVAAMQEQVDLATRLVQQRERLEAIPGLVRKSAAIREAIARSFWVSDVGIATTINLRELVASAIDGSLGLRAGEVLGLPEFVSLARLRGAAHLSAARLETIYRNNLSRSFNDGQMNVLRDPPVKRVVPLLELVEIHDRRTRGSPLPDAESPEGFHWQMHGFVGTAEDFDRLGIVPPNDHNCRGGVRPIPRDEAESEGFIDDDGEVDHDAVRRHNGDRLRILSEGRYPAPGFAN